MAKVKKNPGSGDMDSIRLPDKQEIRALNTPKHRGSLTNQYAESLFSKGESHYKGSFERAIIYEDPAMNLRTSKEEEQEQEEDFSDFNAKEIPKATGLNRGVKLGNQYVKKKTIVIWCTVAVTFLLFMMFAFPPVITDDTSNTAVDKQANVFKDMGMTELKAFALSHYSMNSEKAFTSEKMENYRVVKLVYNARNLSPFKVEIPKFVVKKVEAQYKDRIAYISMADKKENGDQAPVEIPAFSSKEITIEVLVNVADISEKEFNEAVSSMIIATEGMNKKVFGLSVPCIPSYVFVSNNILLDMS